MLILQSYCHRRHKGWCYIDSKNVTLRTLMISSTMIATSLLKLAFSCAKKFTDVNDVTDICENVLKSPRWFVNWDLLHLDYSWSVRQRQSQVAYYNTIYSRNFFMLGDGPPVYKVKLLSSSAERIAFKLPFLILWNRMRWLTNFNLIK